MKVRPEGGHRRQRNAYYHGDQQSSGIHSRPLRQLKGFQLMRHGMSPIGPVKEIEVGEHGQIGRPEMACPEYLREGLVWPNEMQIMNR